jgi:hypothetical protein
MSRGRRIEKGEGKREKGKGKREKAKGKRGSPVDTLHNIL